MDLKTEFYCATCGATNRIYYQLEYCEIDNYVTSCGNCGKKYDVIKGIQELAEVKLTSGKMVERVLSIVVDEEDKENESGSKEIKK